MVREFRIPVARAAFPRLADCGQLSGGASEQYGSRREWTSLPPPDELVGAIRRLGMGDHKQRRPFELFPPTKGVGIGLDLLTSAMALGGACD